MTRAARLPLTLALALAAASCGDVELTSSALAAPGNGAVQPISAPASPTERMEQLDQLHADLELAKLRAAIAKANAEARDASSGPALSAPGAPPLPQLGSNSPLMTLPPIVPPGADAGKGKGRVKDKAHGAEAPAFTLVEAWGAGAERQAIIRSDTGDRLVRIGDLIPVGVVTAISGGAVTYRDARGRTHTID
jgi:hypothetical protein